MEKLVCQVIEFLGKRLVPFGCVNSENVSQSRQIKTRIGRSPSFGRVVFGCDRYNTFDGECDSTCPQPLHDCDGKPVPGYFPGCCQVNDTPRFGETIGKQYAVSPTILATASAISRAGLARQIGRRQHAIPFFPAQPRNRAQKICSRSQRKPMTCE